MPKRYIAGLQQSNSDRPSWVVAIVCYVVAIVGFLRRR